MKRLSFVPLIVLFALVGLISGCTTPSLTMGTIQGTVMGTIDNSRIPDVRITVSGSGGTFVTSSLPDGRYSVAVPAGSYTLTATRQSFNVASYQVAVAGGLTTFRDVTLTTGQNSLFVNPQYQYGLGVFTVPNAVDTRSLTRLFPGSKGTRSAVGQKTALERSAPFGYKFILVLQAETERNSYVNGMRVYYSSNVDGPYVLIGETPIIPTGTVGSVYFTQEMPGLVAGQPGYYQISFWGEGGESSQTISKTIIPFDECILNTPGDGETNVSVAPVLSWAPVYGAVDYYVVVEKWDSLAGSWKYQDDITVDASQTSLTALLDYDTKYRWYVIAEDAAGYTDTVNSVSYMREFTTVAY